MGLYNDLVFTEAVETVNKVLSTTNPDILADELERIASNQDLAHSCLMLLVFKAKGIDISELNGVQLANAKPTISDLILPPGY